MHTHLSVLVESREANQREEAIEGGDGKEAPREQGEEAVPVFLSIILSFKKRHSVRKFLPPPTSAPAIARALPPRRSRLPLTLPWPFLFHHHRNRGCYTRGMSQQTKSPAAPAQPTIWSRRPRHWLSGFFLKKIICSQKH